MREIIEHGDLEDLGGMLREAFESKKRMNPHVTDDTPIDAMLEARAGGRRDGGQDLRSGRRRVPVDRLLARGPGAGAGLAWKPWAGSSRRSTSTSTGCGPAGGTRSGPPPRRDRDERGRRPRRVRWSGSGLPAAHRRHRGSDKRGVPGRHRQGRDPARRFGAGRRHDPDLRQRGQRRRRAAPGDRAREHASRSRTADPRSRPSPSRPTPRC